MKASGSAALLSSSKSPRHARDVESDARTSEQSMPSPRFLLVASYADSIARFRSDLLLELTAAGVSVHAAAPGHVEVGRTALKGVSLHVISLQRTSIDVLADLATILSMLNLLRRVRPDIILPYTVKPVIYGLIASWLVGVPRRFALITGLGYAFTGSRRGVLTRVVAAMYRFALGKAHKVFFQNEDDERLFRDLKLLPNSVPSVVVNGSGVNVDAFSPWPIPPGPPVFLMIARLLGDKGVREYAEAARRVRASYPAVQVRLVGWIDTNPDAIRQSELDSWQAEGVLQFLGKLDDVRQAIADASVYVLPSYREGTPRTVLEAMAMGRPVITTDAPGCRATVVDGWNGFVVPVKDVDDLAAAMLEFVRDPGLANLMGERSRAVAEERYDVRKVNEVMLREMGILPARHENGDHAGG